MSPFSIHPLNRCLLLAFVAAASLSAASDHGGHDGQQYCGDYPGRILTERFLHNQTLSRGAGAASLQPEIEQTLRPDIGDIAIIDRSNGVVAPPNFPDLDGRSVFIDRTEAGYLGEARPHEFDETARLGGVPLGLADDDARAIELPFDFPYFGDSYREAFVHSDGTITFVEPDSGTQSRTFARAASGPPVIAGYFVDLDPTRPGAEVRSYLLPDRAVFTWDAVPQFTQGGSGRPQTFQIELRPDGDIRFHYRTVNLFSVLVGIFDGGLSSEPSAVDLSEGWTEAFPSGVAEIFVTIPNTDIFAAGQRFYRNHDDAYDYLVLFNNIGFTPGPGSFAFEVNVRNEITGIGDLLSESPIVDLGRDFGSDRRLVSFLNMGPLRQYPEDPEAVIPLIGEATTVALLGHETGHRWLAYLDIIDPATGLRSSSTLGRQMAHWSFFLNTDASVLEGNRISDMGEGASPRFRTTGAVSGYSSLDLYGMGLISPEEVGATFFVENPSGAGSSSRARAPQSGVSFDGIRKNITIDDIIAAEGPRVPRADVSPKEFNYAFMLLVDDEAQNAPEADIAKLNRIRQGWLKFLDTATAGRASGVARIHELLELSAWPASGVLAGSTADARVRIARTRDADLPVRLTASNAGIIVPGVVTIPAGETVVDFEVVGSLAGITSLRAEAGVDGFDSPTARIRVLDDASRLDIEVVSGDRQTGARQEALREPVVFVVRDQDRLPYPGVEVQLAASSGGTVTPETGVTDFQGRVAATWRLGDSDNNELAATLAPSPGVTAMARASSAVSRPRFDAHGVVNAASFELGPFAPGQLISIFGVGLAGAEERASEFPLPRTLGGATALLNGTPAAILATTPGQLNVEVPQEARGATMTIRVQAPAGDSDLITGGMAPTAPGVFEDSATGFGAIRYSAGGAAWERPARPCEFLEVYATGLGVVNPPHVSGRAAGQFTLSRTVAQVRVLIDGQAFEPVFSGLAPGFSGLYQVNVKVPEDLAPGEHTLALEADGRVSKAVRFDSE